MRVSDLTRHVVGGLLAAIEARDLRKIHDWLAPDVSWQNVPRAPAAGRDAVLELLAPIITWSDRVVWHVESSSFQPEQAWLERVDRFFVDGNEHAVRCCGVFTIDHENAVVASVRDYVDLGEWRTRIAPVLARLAVRSPLDVVNRHLQAVRSQDIVRMAADYALDALLTRESVMHRGWREITQYFDSVPARLAQRELCFDDPVVLGDGRVQVDWTIRVGSSDAARAVDERAVVSAGVDLYVVEAGRIVDQRVTLRLADF